MKKPLLFIFLILLMLGTFGYFYVNNFLFPVKLKSLCEEKASAFLNREVTISSLNFSLVKGFLLREVRIAERNSPYQKFVTIDEISFMVLLIPLYKEKQVIIPQLEISEPEMHLVRQEQSTWNFSDIQQNIQSSPQNHKPPIIRKLIIKQAAIHYYDNRFNPQFHESFSPINLSAELTLSQSIQFNFDSKWNSRRSSLNLDGEYHLSKKQLDARLEANQIALSEYLPLLIPQDGGQSLNSGFLSSANIEIVAHEEITAKGTASVQNLDFSLKDTFAVKGNYQFDQIELSRKNSQFSLSGVIDSKYAEFTMNGMTLKGDLFSRIQTLQTDGVGKISLMGNLQTENLKFKTPDNFQFKGYLSAQNIDLALHDGVMTVSGKIRSDQSEITFQDTLKFKGTFSNERFTYEQSADALSFSTDLNVAQTDLMINSATSISGNWKTSGLAFRRNADGIKVQGDLSGENAHIKNKDIQIVDNPKILFNGHYSNNTEAWKYDGTVDLFEASVSGIPELNYLDQMTGKIVFKTDTLETKSLALQYNQMPFVLSGSLTSFTKPYVNFQLSSPEANLGVLSKLIPESLVKDYPFEIQGQSSLALSYQGPLDPFDVESLNAKLELKQTFAELKKWDKTIENISGNISYAKDLLTWSNLNLHYLNKSYTLNGQLENFARPLIHTSLAFDDIKLNSQIRLIPKALRIEQFTGRINQSAINITGQADLEDMSNPYLDLAGTFEMNISDLRSLSPQMSEPIESLKLASLLKGEMTYQGTILDWKAARVNIQASTEEFKADKIRLSNNTLRYNQNNNRVESLNVQSSVYGGELYLSANADLLDPQIPFDAKLNVENMDISRLKNDLDVRQKFAGLFNLNTEFRGKIFQVDQLKGAGSFHVVDGYFGQLIPQINKAVFTAASGDFNLGGDRLMTENTLIRSDTIDLKTTGWINFRKELSLEIIPTLGNISVTRDKNVSIDPTQLLKQAISVHITGTFDKPVKKVTRKPLKILENTTGVVKDILQEGGGTISSILDDIFR
ncbi:MAG: AsmA family protein [Candidatus Omnitrophica bacterium]|nr:AsmA family protein [Candidatus Omnitrophota bacterium]